MRFYIGQSFGGHPGDQVNGPVVHKYSYAMVGIGPDLVCNPNGWFLGPDRYDWTEWDRIRDFHRANGAKMLMVFYGSPTWLSRQPDRFDSGTPNNLGMSAPPSDLNIYGRMVRAFIQRYRSDLIAVAAWQEPYGGSDQDQLFFWGPSNELADLVKTIYTNTKAVAPELDVLSPAAPLPASNRVWYLDIKTSSGEPMHHFYDVFAHDPYNAEGDDGRHLSWFRLRGEWQIYKDAMNARGISKPQAVLGWGIADFSGPGPATDFASWSSEDAGLLLYNVAKTAKQVGIKYFTYWMYDPGPTQEAPSRYIRISKAGAQAWQPGGAQPWTYDPVVGAGITRAFDEFATPLN
jgi:hypothetical protein